MKPILKTLVYVCLSALGLLLVAAGVRIAFLRSEYSLPSDLKARRHFYEHKAEFVRFASLLRQDSKARAISSNGVDDIYESDARLVPEYGTFMHGIGAKEAFVRPDGSIEFELRDSA